MPPLDGPGDWKGLNRALARLVRSHFELARLEIAQDTRRFAKDSGRLLAVAAFMGLGWAFLASAFALKLSHTLGVATALALTGAAHLLAGALGLARLRRRRSEAHAAPLRAIRTELGKDRQLWAAVRNHDASHDRPVGAP